MSKQSEISLLAPGASGWEVWKQTAEGEYERLSEGGPLLAGEIEGLPNGDLAMLFPVRAVQFLPFKAASADESLFEDLATMHAERLGIRPDGMAGQLSDSFLIGKEEDSSTLLHVVLQSPGEGELPPRTPKEFDVSARAFPVEGDAVAAWKELGRWVFAIFKEGKLLYAQATSCGAPEPDSGFLQEIHLALGQLGIQGLGVQPKAVHVWPAEGELGDAGSLADGLGVAAVVERRPDPQMASPPSRLLPEDVRAARKERQKRNQMAAVGALAGLAYLGVFAWLGFGLWQDSKKRKNLASEAAEVEAISTSFELHRAKWDELGPVVDETHCPVDVLLHIARAIPRNSGLRLTTADISLDEIKLLGAAPTSGPVNTFSLALKRSADLSWLEWENQAPNNTSKGWELTFTATPIE